MCTACKRGACLIYGTKVCHVASMDSSFACISSSFVGVSSSFAGVLSGSASGGASGELMLFTLTGECMYTGALRRGVSSSSSRASSRSRSMSSD